MAWRIPVACLALATLGVAAGGLLVAAGARWPVGVAWSIAAGIAFAAATTALLLVVLRSALEDGEERFRSLFDQSGEAILGADLEGRFTSANPAATRVLGYTREELARVTFRQITPERWRALNEEAMRQVSLRGCSDEFEKEYARKDGTTVPVSVRLLAQRDASGRRVGTWAIVRDITERRLSSEALRESDERFQLAFHTSLDSISIGRLADGVFLTVNQGFTRMTGWSEAEARGRSALDLRLWVDPTARAPYVAALARHGRVENVELTWRRKNGDTFPGLTSAQLFPWRGEQYVLSTTRDLTEVKRAEGERQRLRAELHQAAKMEAVGQLAGGIAHDFNNLLTVILSGAEALRCEATEGSSVREVAEEIRAAAARARDLTRQLLAFARRQVISPVPLDLNHQLRTAEKLLHRLLGEDVELVVDLQPDLWPVRCDAGQLEQLVLNLTVNARDAMPSGGRLTLATANLRVEARPTGCDPSMPPGEYVRLSVQDTGQGMSDEVIAHAFEPFFTTKPVGQGTGLGLATVYGIVQQNGGYVRVRSALGEGACFELYFPRIHAHVADAPVEHPAAAGPRGTELVLLAEDDAAVREVTSRALQAAGYRVLSASRGKELIEVSARLREEAHLLVTDVVMPDMDGAALSEALRRQRPALRVLFVSGYDREILARRGALAPGLELLPKPFTPSALLERVRRVLDEAR